MYRAQKTFWMVSVRVCVLYVVFLIQVRPILFILPIQYLISMTKKDAYVCMFHYSQVINLHVNGVTRWHIFQIFWDHFCFGWWMKDIWEAVLRRAVYCSHGTVLITLLRRAVTPPLHLNQAMLSGLYINTCPRLPGASKNFQGHSCSNLRE